MFATLVVIAFAKASLAVVAVPDWNTDYAQALNDAGAATKPLAVFMGRGKDGWKQVSGNGELKPEALKLLKERYVCLYIDTSSNAGRELAAAFGNTEQTGVVLSDKSAKYQIFKHSGSLDDSRLRRALEEHVAHVVPQQLIQRTSHYQPSGTATPTYSGGFSGSSAGVCRG